MDYLNFDVRLGSRVPRGIEVVVDSPGGQGSGVLALPNNFAVPEPASVSRRLQTRSGSNSPPAPNGSAGTPTELSKALFSDLITRLYIQSRQQAEREGYGLRVRLRVVNRELAEIPWEYLQDPTTGEPLSLSRDTPVVRYQERPRPAKSIEVQSPLSVLVMISAPSDQPALGVDAERALIENASAALRGSGLLKLTFLEGSTPGDLRKAMRKGPFHVFHFIGHGGFAAEEGAIALTNNDGTTQLYTASRLSRVLHDHEPLRLVILNSCEGATFPKQTALQSTAEVLVTSGVPAVIAMQYAISDEAALIFSRELYEAIADHFPIDASLAEARKAIADTANVEDEWATPVIYLRADSGSLFTFNAEKFSAIRKDQGYDALANQAPPTDTISAVLAPMLRWVIRASVSVIGVIGLNYLMVIGTDARLGTKFRPSGLDEFPILGFPVELIRAFVNTIRANPLIVALLMVGLAGVVFLIWPANSASHGAGSVNRIQGFRLKVDPFRRQVISALVIVASASAVYLSWPALELQRQLDTNVLIKTIANPKRAHELPKVLACMSLAGNAEAMERLELPCRAERLSTFADSEGVNQRWLTMTSSLVLIALLAIAFLNFVDRTFPLRMALFGSRIAMAASKALALTAVAALGLSYGVIARPLRPPYVKINRGTATICEGYRLTDNTLYNPPVGAVEEIPEGAVYSPASNGQNRDMIRDRFVFLLSNENSDSWSCRAATSSTSP
jgi:hypothetical protein